MKIRCPACDASYSIRPSDRPRRATCKQCGESIHVPAASIAPTGPESRSGGGAVAAQDADREHPKRPEPRTAATLWIGALSILQGTAGVAFAFLAATTTILTTQGYLLPGEGLGLFLAMQAVFAVVLLGSGIGMLFARPWAWWLNAMFQLGSAFMQLRALLILGKLNWGHHAADDIAATVLVSKGLPFLANLVVLALLCLPSVRIACGVKDRPRERRHRAPAAGRARATKGKS